MKKRRLIGRTGAPGMIKGRHINSHEGSNAILDLGRGSLGEGTKIIESKLS